MYKQKGWGTRSPTSHGTRETTPPQYISLTWFRFWWAGTNRLRHTRYLDELAVECLCHVHDDVYIVESVFCIVVHVPCSCSASDMVQFHDPLPQAYISTVLSNVSFGSMVDVLFAGILYRQLMQTRRLPSGLLPCKSRQPLSCNKTADWVKYVKQMSL